MSMRIVGERVDELRSEGKRLLAEAKEVFLNKEADAQDKEKAGKMLARVDAIKAEIDQLVAIKAAEEGTFGVATAQAKDQKTPATFKGFGEFLVSVFMSEQQGKHDPRLGSLRWKDPEEPNVDASKMGWIENTKDLLESVGASGGFLVPTDQSTNMLLWTPPESIIQSRATVIPIRRRAIQIPTLNQTATTAGQPHWWGGLLARWTEEAAQKEETQPSFRQIMLTAHKLVVYTEASDELLADSAVSLEAFLSAGFGQVIQWYKDHAFVNGTGAGQPFGVIPGPATITVAPAAIGAIAVADFANMLEAFVGQSPVWMLSRQWMNQLIQLNGPAANPSYVFIPSARDGVPGTLFGYPIYWSEHMPLPGVAGSVLLADWSKYLIGDRQAVTIDSSKHFRFQNDLTAWRAVSRVDGQQWLSAPLTYSDGSTQVSPFVILGANPAS
jgi:HK97 family phage major capsid protein